MDEEEEFEELEDEDVGEGTLGNIIYSRDIGVEAFSEVSFRTIHSDPLPFKDRRRRIFIPHTPITVRIVKYERNVTHHILNPYLYTIEVRHDGFTWFIYKRYRHIQLLHQQMKLFRATLILPFPGAKHRSDRQSFKELKEKGEDGKGNSKSSLPRFPKKPEVMISYDQIDERISQLEDYLNKLFNIQLYREHPDSVYFLLCSHLSFVKGLGIKGREGKVKKQTGSTRRGCDCFGISDCDFCLRCSHVCSDTCGRWRERWLFVKDTFMGYIRPRDGTIRGILLFDQGFEISAGFYSSGMRNRFQVLNLQRRIVFKCTGNRKRQGWTDFIKDISGRQGYGFIQPNRNSSFAPPRSNCKSQWFVDGSSYMSHVADAILNAKEEIFIADWWLSPEIYLKRPALHGYYWRLDALLQMKALQGVKIFILLYKEVELALGLNSYYSKSILSGLHLSNIKVLRHPDHANSGVFLWAHHEKIVCIDQNIAFLGGLDLCYGRWDTHEHRLTDFGGLRRDIRKNQDTRKFTSSRPSGRKHSIPVLLTRDFQNTEPEAMTVFDSKISSDVAQESDLITEKDIDFVVPFEAEDKPKKENENSVSLNDNKDGHVNCEHAKCDTPEIEKRSDVQRFKQVLAGKFKTFKNCCKNEKSEDPVPEGAASSDKLEEKIGNVKLVRPVECSLTDGSLDEINIQPEDLSGAKFWIGKDYTNFIVKDFCDLDSPFQDLVDRNSTPRMPWHDIGAVVQGAAARDVARHFIQRWNAVKVEKAKKIDSIPYLMPKSYEHFDDLPYAKFNVKCQVLRSISSWSGGYLDPDIWEESIHEAYITSIAKAKHYIYIENQFFISLARHNPYVKNQVGEAICKRIVRAHKESKKFRVYIILPLLPGFEGEVGAASGTALHAITHWNYASICRGNDSIISRLQELGIENPSEYITFHGLRTYSEFYSDHVTELIYVHSKLMIVDDKLVICGSANINDRSLLGKRDSEIAVLIEDEEFTEIEMDGSVTEVGKYAFSLRKRLFREHLGLLSGSDDKRKCIHNEDFDITDPICDKFFKNTWLEISQNNTRIYEEVFRCLPSDRVTTFKDLESYLEEIPLLASDAVKAKELLTQIRGHLVNLPLNFLMNENLTPTAKSVEGFMPTVLWT